MSRQRVCGLASALLTRLELHTLTRISEAYCAGFRDHAESDRVDDFLRAMSPADYRLFRALLLAGALLPAACLRWLARCEAGSTDSLHYRLAAPLHFPLKTIARTLYYGASVERQIGDSRVEFLGRNSEKR